MKQAKTELPSGEFCFQEVPEIALSTNMFCNMGYLVYKAWDKSTFVTDEEILADGIRFLTTGKSKYSNATLSDSLKDAAVKLPPGSWQLLGADPTRLSEVEAGEIVECLCKPVLSGMIAGVYKNYNLEAERTKWAKERVKLKSKLDTLPVHPETATASLDSLAASLGISKPYCVLKNIEK